MTIFWFLQIIPQTLSIIIVPINAPKIIIADANGNDKSVWGFINLTHERFLEGDVLLAQGWAGPALNKPRGNVYAGFEINRRTVYGPGYCSGVVAGTKRDGSFV